MNRLVVLSVVLAVVLTGPAWAGEFANKPADYKLQASGDDVQSRALPTSCDPPNCPRPGHPTQRCDGVDLVLNRANDLTSLNHEGVYPNGETGFCCATDACNNGCVRIGWHAPMEEDHPGILLNIYRLTDDRLTQIGAHFVKHAFYALSSNSCGYGCEGTSGGTEMWIGCSDTYSVGNNASRYYLGPRDEWSPYKGTWNCVGSHFSGGVADCVRRHTSAGHSGNDHWTRVQDQDLLTPGAQFFYDGYYVVNGDVDKYNNIGYNPVTFAWDVNSQSWIPTSNPSTLYHGVILNPAIWGDEHVTIDSHGEGDVIVGMASADLGGGVWHYEYAAYNFNYNRRVRSFSVPISSGAVVTNVGFHGTPLEEQSQAPWIVTQTTDALTWELDDLATPHNALIFGSMDNFWFDIDAAPETSQVTLEPYLTGGGTSPLAAQITGPAVAPAPCGDFDGDGDVDLNDFSVFASCFAGSDNPPAAGCPPGADADCDGDGDVDLNDFSIFGQNFTGSL